MPLITFQFLAALAILVMALVAGLPPLRLAKAHQRFLSIGDAFASGVFLSAAFFHMLPDAEAGFRAVMPDASFPYANLVCVATFVAVLFLERGITHLNHAHHHDCSTAVAAPPPTPLTPYLLVAVLSVHSLIEGAALGITSTFAGSFIIFAAIIAHKGSASFALAMKLRHYSVPRQRAQRLIILFSLVTPLGIGLAVVTGRWAAPGPTHQLLEAGFNAIAAGTFLYLGTLHTSVEPRVLSRLGEASALVLGVALMAVVAIWV